jgi:hypothetical protein
MILTMGRPSTVVRRTLGGFTSRWITPRLCACLNPATDLDEQLLPGAQIEPVVVTVSRDSESLDELHHEEGFPVGVSPASNTLAMFG